MWNTVRGCAGAGFLALVALSGRAAEGDTVAELSTFDNAAYDYWKAAALIQDVLTEDEFEYALFAEQELPGLPPKAFAHHPGSGRWLLNERLMLEALHQGAGKDHCRFLREAEMSAHTISLYRSSMRRVIHRALASAKAHEFVGNRLAAGSIYADLLRLLRHMDEGGDWAAVQFTMEHLPDLLDGITGFLSRRPPRNATELIIQELDDVPSPRFPIQRMLAREALTYSEWFLSDPDQVEAKIGGLYGDAIVKPALNELLQLAPEEDTARVQTWMDGYRDEMSRLGAAMNLPYEEAIQVIREIDGTVAAVSRSKEDTPDNPLLSLLMPPMAETYERFVAMEARLAMINVLCKGAVYADFVGEWPDDIDMLRQFASGSLPKDPFTGNDLEYDLRGALPRVRAELPRHLRNSSAVEEINLRRRVEADEEALASMVREMQRKQRMEESIARQREKKDGDPAREDESSRSLRSRVNRGLVY